MSDQPDEEQPGDRDRRFLWEDSQQVTITRPEGEGQGQRSGE